MMSSSSSCSSPVVKRARLYSTDKNDIMTDTNNTNNTNNTKDVDLESTNKKMAQQQHQQKIKEQPQATDSLYKLIGTRRRYFSNELTRLIMARCISHPNDAKWKDMDNNRRVISTPLHRLVNMYWEDIRTDREEQNALLCLRAILGAYSAAIYEANFRSKLPISIACERMPRKHWEFLYERTKFLTPYELTKCMHGMPQDVAEIICGYMYTGVLNPFDVGFAVRFLMPITTPRNVMINYDKDENSTRMISCKYGRVRDILHGRDAANSISSYRSKNKAMTIKRSASTAVLLDFLCRQNMMVESPNDRKLRVQMLCEAISSYPHSLIMKRSNAHQHPPLHSFLICSLPIAEHQESIIKVLDLIRKVCPQAMTLRGHRGRTALHYFFSSLHEARLYNKVLTAKILDRSVVRQVISRFPRGILFAKDANDMTVQDLAKKMFRLNKNDSNADIALLLSSSSSKN